MWYCGHENSSLEQLWVQPWSVLWFTCWLVSRRDGYNTESTEETFTRELFKQYARCKKYNLIPKLEYNRTLNETVMSWIYWNCQWFCEFPKSTNLLYYIHSIASEVCELGYMQRVECVGLHAASGMYGVTYSEWNVWGYIQRVECVGLHTASGICGVTSS